MTASTSTNNRLFPPVDESVDHVLGPTDSEITLVEYGSYDCPYCRAANERVTELRDEFGDEMRYVWRHRPIPGSEAPDRGRGAAAIIIMLGSRVPVELRIFLTAATIVDDIGAILVVAFFYSEALQPAWQR